MEPILVSELVLDNLICVQDSFFNQTVNLKACEGDTLYVYLYITNPTSVADYPSTNIAVRDLLTTQVSIKSPSYNDTIILQKYQPTDTETRRTDPIACNLGVVLTSEFGLDPSSLTDFSITLIAKMLINCVASINYYIYRNITIDTGVCAIGLPKTLVNTVVTGIL